VANYRLPAATGDGYTLLGSPTVIAKIDAPDTSSEVAARLWDVAPDGTQEFITRALFRPDPGSSALQVFQLHPNGWHFAAGHVPKLELLAKDSPYGRQSNSTAGFTVSDLQLRLPVHEQPDGSVIRQPLEPFFPGQKLPKRICGNAIKGTRRADRLAGTELSDRITGGGGNDRISGLKGIDCIRGQGGADRLRGDAGDDRLSGEAGNDRVSGGPGSDVVRGGAGRDVLSGGAGNDLINSRDGRRDVVRCGTGKHDRSRADRRDRLIGCEVVFRPRH
jgi:hypothetical protein